VAVTSKPANCALNGSFVPLLLVNSRIPKMALLASALASVGVGVVGPRDLNMS
jgi:hypothetical protein